MRLGSDAASGGRGSPAGVAGHLCRTRALRPSWRGRGPALLWAGLFLGAPVTRAESLDWRHVDPNLPFDPAFIHPSKALKYRDTRNLNFRLMGLPIEMGWEVSRTFEDPSRIDYRVQSVGKYCNNNGLPFLVDDMFTVEECQMRCTLAPNCAFVTAYLNTDWCQLMSRCTQEDEAGEPSAVTFAKVVRKKDDGTSVCQAGSGGADCLGEWVAEFGRPLKSGMRNRPQPSDFEP
mmetsp:Transcript_20065/g.45287  ORF Transcript_20065/g.45287 Transcript_20065/m.45287 type:complete len:233 (+) Transcript_20065:102-800(+)